MDAATFYELLFEPLSFLGPGTDADTRRLIAGLDLGASRPLLELGAGQGRSAVLAARETGACVRATDASATFVARIVERARAAGVASLVTATLADLRQLSELGPAGAILCEGAAYVAGLDAFLAGARTALEPARGRLALSYPIRREVPGCDDVLSFWRPQLAEELRTLTELVTAAEAAGMRVVDAWSYDEVPWRTYLDPVAARLPEIAGLIPPCTPAAAELAAFEDEIRVQLGQGGWRAFTYGAVVAVLG